MYCAFSEETLEVLSQRESIRRQLASETGTGELFITYFHEILFPKSEHFHESEIEHSGRVLFRINFMYQNSEFVKTCGELKARSCSPH